MAAIIAQMTRQNRERAKKKRYESAKCMYELPPFDPHYDPKIHNKYMARRQAYIKQEAERQLLEEITKKFEEERKKKQVQVKFTWKVCLIECGIITLLLSIVPLIVLFIELFWSYGVVEYTGLHRRH
ncbi:uncharacterized protein LOC111700276 [Eurytemora carolleeae]|uniref:uncharacterized protein LOC111700276 n=1 Tax=Eurytemora carolleeae TaxID=1294199 RepID=UPI000C784188|nr:uncharacterized protein LOC111700276 [Eurytemora carolleeae]|eukprot:XP_023326920.1 uncharacterized protein LOC111700276 [Eurytemora affinis]